MNYLYDILLNFNSRLYETFEWEKSDCITHIRKMPFFKISSKQLYELLNYKIEFTSEFLSNIFKKTEYFAKNKISYIDYAFLVTDGKEIFAIKINKGILNYSKLLYEEEFEALEYSDNLKLKNIDYEMVSQIPKDCFMTRNESNIKKYIYREINKMLVNDNLDKLNYLYLECFNQKEVNDLKNNIYIELENNWDEVYLKIYNFLKMTLPKY